MRDGVDSNSRAGVLETLLTAQTRLVLQTATYRRQTRTKHADRHENIVQVSHRWLRAHWPVRSYERILYSPYIYIYRSIYPSIYLSTYRPLFWGHAIPWKIGVDSIFAPVVACALDRALVSLSGTPVHIYLSINLSIYLPRVNPRASILILEYVALKDLRNKTEL